MRHILITGATGTLGSQLLPLFSKEPDTLVYILIRAAAAEELHSRFRKLSAFLELTEEQAAKIIPVAGDVSEPLMGMSPEFYRELCNKCTQVIHAAASIKLNMTPQEAEHATLVPTRNILEYVHACRSNGSFRKFDYVSTIGVAGKLQGLIEERFLHEPHEFHNNYEKYKSQAEALVYEQMQAGLPATIHRPSMIVGDSRDGRIIHFQGFYFLTRFFAGQLTCGFLPNLPKLTLDTVPVDYVAACIHWSASDPAASGRILHYTSAGKSLSAVEFIHLARKAYAENGRSLPRLRLTDPGLFITTARLIRMFCFGRTRSHLRHLLLFLTYTKNEQIFDNTKTTALLAQHGICLPDPTSYLSLVIGYFLRKGKL